MCFAIVLALAVKLSPEINNALAVSTVVIFFILVLPYLGSGSNAETLYHDNEQQVARPWRRKRSEFITIKFELAEDG